MLDLMAMLALTALGMTVGVIAAAAMFVRRQRQALMRALEDNNRQQAEAMQQMVAALTAAQQRQRQSEQQMQSLAQAALRLRQDLTALAQRVERGQTDTATDRVLH